MKYLLLFIMTILSMYGVSVDVTDGTKIRKWLKNKPWRRKGFVLAFFLSAATIVCTWRDDADAKATNQELQKTLAEANKQILSQTERLEAQEKMLVEQKASLVYQQNLMIEQAKSVGSVLFNTETSFEGKERFLRSFSSLADRAKINTLVTGFEGLICPDGVAMYWFDSRTETITGFYFFTNAEINRILSGIPVTDDIGENGKLIIKNDTELSKVFTECLFRKTPTASENIINAKRAEAQVLHEIEVILRYVYRAENVNFSPMFFSSNSKEPLGVPTGSYALTFRYAVNPFASAKQYRSISWGDIEISKTFLDSLYGVTMAQFSERIIENFRSNRLEPKVRVKDIRILKQKAKTKAWRNNSPFQP